MDVYQQYSTPDCFRIDELLDFSNDDPFSFSSSSSSASAASTVVHHHLLPPPPPLPLASSESDLFYRNCPSSSASFDQAALSTDFTDNLSIPSDDVAELEWLSQFVDDSFAEFPPNPLSSSQHFLTDEPLSGTVRSKRSRGKATDTATQMSAATEYESPAAGKPRTNKETRRAPSSQEEEGGVRRCMHCASEKTPQWRSGPMGPKTLCNACGVRYKSGRLVPEYRPAASPTFVLTEHSNSHRKVMELRRQKEMLRLQRPQEILPDGHQQHNIYHHNHNHHHHHHEDFQVC